MQEFDVYLNDVGYMLAKDGRGRLLSGAAREQRSDPFASYVTQGERWKRVGFQFRDGSGCLRYDGSERYAWGYNIDSRSGDILLGPHWTLCDDNEGEIEEGYQTTDPTPGVRRLSTQGGHYDGFAVRFQASRTANVRTVGLLVKRDPTEDYSAAGTFTVEIQGNAAGPKPSGIAAATTTASIKVSPVTWQPYENLWIAGEWFWLEVSFAAGSMAALTSGTWYWVCVINNQQPELDWAYSQSESGTVSEWNGVAWSNGVTSGCPFVKVKWHDEIDGFARSFADFMGADSTRRLYAAVGPKVMYWDEPTTTWANSKGDFADRVLKLLAYNGYLFAAQGDSSNMFYSDGTTATTVWTDSGVTARALALHDNLIWKATGRRVMGATTGLVGNWTANAVDVGDPGLPVVALQSHGGKLYALKPEGVFEITYPDTYPTSGTPTSNLVLDFRTEITGRNWMLDWHTALYFPGHVGLYEWKSGILQDTWRERFTDDGDESLLPLYDGDVGKLTAVAGSTRGMALGRGSPFIPDGSPAVWWFDGRTFHPQLRDVYAAERMQALHVQSTGIGRGLLWFGLGFDMGVVWWPTWTDDRSQDDDSEFYDAAGLVVPYSLLQLPVFDDGRMDQLKDFYQVAVYTDNAGAAAGGEVEITAMIDGAGTALGTIDTSPIQVLTFPANTTGYSIYLTMVLLPSTSTETIRIRQIDLRFQPLPDTIGQHNLVISAERVAGRRTGGPDSRSASEIVQALTALLEETEPWEYVDVFGISHCVRAVGVTAVPTGFERLPSGTGVEPEGQVIVQLLEVAASCPEA